MEYTVSLMKQVLQKYERQGRVTKNLLSPILACDENLTNYFNKLSELNKKIRNLKRNGSDKYALEDAKTEKAELKARYDECIDKFINLSLGRLHDREFHLHLEKVTCKGKDAFQVGVSLENMLFMGMLNRNLRSCYKIQPANRFPILHVLKELLEENHEVIILRLDIKSFFESIPFADLQEKLIDDGILCPESFKLLRKINEEYQRLSDAHVGIPRGVPCSSFLAEIYMRDIDSKIKDMPGVYYYQRYVDDMIILIYPKDDGVQPKLYFERISKIVSQKRLTLHSLAEHGKTRLIDSRTAKTFMFSYLGYRINKWDGKINFSLSPDKYGFYEKWIHRIFLDFKHEIRIRKQGALTKLLHQLRLMTSNYHLVGNKHQVMSGIFYKYPFLTSTSQLVKLDELLNNEISCLSIDDIPMDMGHFASVHFSRQETLEYIIKRCSKYSFVEGYNQVKKSNMCTASFKKYKISLP